METNLAWAGEAASFAAIEAIASVLHKYVEAARIGDGGLMRSVFLETAHVRGSYGVQPVEWTLSEFCRLIDEGGPAPQLTARIVHIDRAGPAAAARLEAADWRGTRYTDFFVLVETASEWRIASKVFFAHSRARDR